MREEEEYYIKNSLQGLEDLKYLVKEDCHKIIDQISFYLNELIVSSKSKNAPKVGSHSELKKIITEKIITNFKDILLTNVDCKKINFVDFLEKKSFGQIDKLLGIVEEVKEVLSLCLPGNSIDFVIHADRLEVTSEFDVRNINGDNLVHIYSCFRKLLSKKVLLVYKLRKDINKVTLVFDLSHSQNGHYRVNLQDEVGLELLFSNTLPNYYVGQDTLHKLKKHLCLEITADLKVHRHEAVPRAVKEKFVLRQFQKEVFYFPFLFRPISIIIPKRGEIVSKDLILDNTIGHRNDGSAQSCESIFKVKNSKWPQYYLDFFHLLVANE